MLTFDSLKLFTTTSSGTSVTLRANLIISGFCTDFLHDASEEFFDGEALFVAVPMVERIVGATTSEITDSFFVMPMTVVKSGFDTVASTGACVLTGNLTSVPGVAVSMGAGSTFTFSPLTGLSATLGLAMAAGSPGITGSIYGDVAFGPAGEAHFTRTVVPHEISLTAGCPL